MERKTLENSKESRDHAVLVGLRSPVLGDDSADEESLMELSEPGGHGGRRHGGHHPTKPGEA